MSNNPGILQERRGANSPLLATMLPEELRIDRNEPDWDVQRNLPSDSLKVDPIRTTTDCPYLYNACHISHHQTTKGSSSTISAAHLTRKSSVTSEEMDGPSILMSEAKQSLRSRASLLLCRSQSSCTRENREANDENSSLTNVKDVVQRLLCSTMSQKSYNQASTTRSELHHYPLEKLIITPLNPSQVNTSPDKKQAQLRQPSLHRTPPRAVLKSSMSLIHQIESLPPEPVGMERNSAFRHDYPSNSAGGDTFYRHRRRRHHRPSALQRSPIPIAIITVSDPFPDDDISVVTTDDLHSEPSRTTATTTSSTSTNSSRVISSGSNVNKNHSNDNDIISTTARCLAAWQNAAAATISNHNQHHGCFGMAIPQLASTTMPLENETTKRLQEWVHRHVCGDIHSSAPSTTCFPQYSKMSRSPTPPRGQLRSRLQQHHQRAALELIYPQMSPKQQPRVVTPTSQETIPAMESAMSSSDRAQNKTLFSHNDFSARNHDTKDDDEGDDLSSVGWAELQRHVGANVPKRGRERSSRSPPGSTLVFPPPSTCSGSDNPTTDTTVEADRTADGTMSRVGVGRRRKNVSFANPMVTAVRVRPVTQPEEVSTLYFVPEELETLSMDRANCVLEERFECIATTATSTMDAAEATSNEEDWHVAIQYPTP